MSELARSLQKAMDELLKPQVPDRLESYLYRWYLSANASGRCNLRPVESQVCQQQAFIMLGGRHVDPTECLHLAGLTFYLCEEHAPVVLSPAPWICSLCLAPSQFTEPVQLGARHADP